MTQIATVEERLRPGLVRIAVARETACGHDCAHCGGCGAAGGQVLRVSAADPLDTAPGDKVVVESDTGQVLSAAALVYLLPLLGLLAGCFAAASLGGWGQAAGGAAGLVLGMAPAVVLSRRRRIAFRILEKL